MLITGAAGGVGHLAVQLGARSGARVTAVAGRPERAAGLRELGATDVVVGIEQAQGRFGLILKSAGGASLATALHAVEANGAVVVFGNSSGEMTSISLADFRGGQNARLQSFFSFTSGPENQFGPNLALLVSLVADKVADAANRAGAELARHCAGTDELRDRRVGGKAVFRESETKHRVSTSPTRSLSSGSGSSAILLSSAPLRGAPYSWCAAIATRVAFGNC